MVIAGMTRFDRVGEATLASEFRPMYGFKQFALGEPVMLATMVRADADHQQRVDVTGCETTGIDELCQRLLNFEHIMCRRNASRAYQFLYEIMKNLDQITQNITDNFTIRQYSSKPPRRFVELITEVQTGLSTVAADLEILLESR